MNQTAAARLHHLLDRLLPVRWLVGMLFTRAYSSNPLCMPFRNSVFTGRYPYETGVTQNAGPQGGLDPKEFVCLGTCFRNASYHTAYSGK